jgi:membrane protease YdiL (CAAX protease family)
MHPADHLARPPALLAWAAFVAGALVALEFFDLTVYGILIPLAAAALYQAIGRRGSPTTKSAVDGRDLHVIGAVYLVVVGLFFAAFEMFGTDAVLGLFLCFAAGLVVGVAVPVVYTVWWRHRPLASLGLGLHQLPLTIALGLLFAGIQFALTLWGYDLPASGEDWVPLLVMALVVGIFESIFFRGFLQGRLVAMFGPGLGIVAAAGLYGLYHVGYGMGLDEMTFLFGLGFVYAIAYSLVGNLLVLWPLLTPLGSFYANVDAGDIDLPWSSIAGFLDVAAVMIVVLVIAHRHERRVQLADAAARRRTGPSDSGVPQPTSAGGREQPA